MNNYQKIYWLTRLDSIQTFTEAAIILSIISIVTWIFIRYAILPIECGDDTLIKTDRKAKWPIRFALTAVLVCLLSNLFIPNKNEMIMIYAGGKTMDYIQTDTSISKIPHQATAIISKKLDEYLNECKK